MPKHAFKFISGKYQGGEFPIPDDGEILIGRASELDLVLVEDMVSRKHAKLVLQGGTATITDLGSTNGTFVNGEKIRRAELKRNDRILIGTSILKVIAANELTTLDERTRGDKQAVKAQMERLGNRAGPETSQMSGDLQEVPLPDLLQLFATNRKAGILTIKGTNNGAIVLKNGQIQYARIKGKDGMPAMKALCRMVNWSSGNFVLEPYDDTAKYPETFSESTESLLIEAMRQCDEVRRIEKSLPKPEDKLVWVIPLVPKLSDLKKNELDILQTILNFDSFEQVLDNSTESDHAVAMVTHKLMNEGYLEVE